LSLVKKDLGKVDEDDHSNTEIFLSVFIPLATVIILLSLLVVFLKYKRNIKEKLSLRKSNNETELTDIATDQDISGENVTV
jgi:hypothetical protein